MLNLFKLKVIKLKHAEAKGSFKSIHGMLKGRTNGARLSIDQISDAIADAAAHAGAGSS